MSCLSCLKYLYRIFLQSLKEISIARVSNSHYDNVPSIVSTGAKHACTKGFYRRPHVVFCVLHFKDWIAAATVKPIYIYMFFLIFLTVGVYGRLSASTIQVLGFSIKQNDVFNWYLLALENKATYIRKHFISVNLNITKA